jgi:hypothetical protein
MIKNKYDAGSITLAARILPAAILAIALVLFASAAPSSTTRVRGHINQLALSAVKEYAHYSCDENLTIAQCHEEKLKRALLATRALNARNTELVGNTSVKLSPSRGNRNLFLEPLRYYHSGDEALLAERNCSSFPCLSALKANETATAFRISGQINMDDSSVLSFAGRIFGATQRIDLDVAAAANLTPTDFVIAVDKSPSTAWDTHLDSSATVGCVGDCPAAAAFAFEVEWDGAAYTPIDKFSLETYNALPDTRPLVDPPSNPQFHFKDDYTKEEEPVWAWGFHESHHNRYPFKQYHPHPVDSPHVLKTAKPNSKSY